MLSNKQNQLQTHTAFALWGLDILSQRLLQRKMHYNTCLFVFKCLMKHKQIMSRNDLGKKFFNFSLVIQPWWLRGQSSSFAIFKDSNPSQTQVQIALGTYKSEREIVTKKQSNLSHRCLWSPEVASNIYIRLVFIQYILMVDKKLI